MKKILVCLFVFAFVFGAFATNNTARIALLEKTLAANADNKLYCFSLSTRIAILKMDKAPADWTALKDYVKQSVETAISKKQIEAGPNYYKSVCFAIACWDTDSYAKEAFKEAVQMQHPYVWNFIRKHGDKKLGLTKEQEVDILNNFLAGKFIQKRPDLAYSIVKTYVQIITEIDPVKAKEGLNKLNRTLTPYLVNDKPAWEPVVALIRTALETY